jgi:electron transfer flavoprotein alpha subunit
MRVLIVIESGPAGPDGDSIALLAHAAALAEESMALMFGSALHETAIEVVGQTGVGRIMIADAAEFDGPLIGARVATIDAVLARAPVDAVLFAPSLVAPELAGTLGATLGASVAWGLTDLSLDAGVLKATRPVNDDSEIVDVTWSDGPALAVFRSFSGEASPSSRRGTIEHVPPATARNVPRIVRQERAESSSQNRLEDARIVVAGGRGVGSTEGLDLVRDLAGAMGAAFGVSLPVVDSGWAPRDRQVGQTGTVIAPDLYVACGISGQIQHRLGIARSRYIVAINNDPDAPIMRWADLAIVGDLHALLPKLTDEIRRTGIN